jgi:putative sterol carrier protein|tara:strand:- start:283 stop:522 length:240 start_codon:yes stop_codon:yes gene_type:complete
MLYKANIEGYTFIQEDSSSKIKAYKTLEDVSGLTPDHTSSVTAASQKDFEVEASYIYMDILNGKYPAVGSYSFYEGEEA